MHEVVIVDTSILVELERGGDAVDKLRGRPAAVAAITVAELLHGARRADTAERRAHREAFAESVVAWLPVVDFDLPVARRYAALWADTLRLGTPVGAHDLMVAATAQLLGWSVLTRNQRDFARIPGTTLAAAT